MQNTEGGAEMAKVTFVIRDNERGQAVVEYAPEPNFDSASDNLTMAQELSMLILDFVHNECETEISDGENSTLQ
jgi:hypothetical protein